MNENSAGVLSRMLSFKRDQSRAAEPLAANPLVAREWRARWRDRRSFGLLLAYVVLFALLVAWRYQNAISALAPIPSLPSGAIVPTHEYSWIGMARIGRQIFLT